MKYKRTVPAILIAGAALGTLGILAFRGGLSPPIQGLPEGKMRIVSLAPSVTEMLFVLGVGDSVVGVTSRCDYPPEAKRIEPVGGFGTPNVETLLALSPDLVVAAGFERSEALRPLRASGIRVLEVKMHKLDDVFQALRQIGEAVGKSPRASEIIEGIQAERKDVAAQYGNIPPDRLPRVFVELWDDPLTTVGGASFLDDVIAWAGGVNVAHELPQPHPRVSPEKVIEWNPDVIVVAHMTRGGDATARIAERIGWSGLTAVKNGRIVRDIPPDLLLRPGPRLIEGVKALAHRLHGQVPQTGSVANEVSRTCP
jgi:iron complex transport system substrate-binding protein